MSARVRSAAATLLLLCWGALIPGAAATVRVVSPAGPYPTLAAALEAAAEGDTIQVRGGVHPGPVRVDRRLRLEGVGWPVIDGGGRDSVVTLAAPGIVFRGFVVRGGGARPEQGDCGIDVVAPGVTVEGNRLREVLDGIACSRADGSVLRDNDIRGMERYDLGRKGDGMRLWYSKNLLVAGNRLEKTRDLVAWYCQDIHILDNDIADGRYAVHFMYSDRARVEGNRMQGNSVGVYTMYSRGIILRSNLVSGCRGPSGYALGFKDADDVVVEGNALLDNRVGLFLDSTPQGSRALFRGNLVAFNDVGVDLFPSVRGATFEGNDFWENRQQVAIEGGGGAAGNLWQGNFWSDYGGYDAAGDGEGDVPYVSERLFENLADRSPILRYFQDTPAQGAVDMAARLFPLVRPTPKLEDARPRMRAVLSPLLPPPPRADHRRGPSGWLMLTLTALLGLPGGLLLAARGARAAKFSGGENMNSAAPLVEMHSLTRRFGRLVAVDRLTASVAAGQAVALWGANGAGKTTVLRCLLGLLAFEGQARVAGWDVRRQGRQARRSLGYVPQELRFHEEMTARETLRFYAALKKVDPVSIPELLALVELEEHADKPVGALSGGTKQRLALAVALLGDPPLLLLDEPAASLDLGARHRFLELLRRLKARGKTLIFSAHRLEEVAPLADRVLVLESGRLTRDCSPQELGRELSRPRTLKLYLPQEKLERALAELAARGMGARCNGRGLWVQVTPGQRAAPILALRDAGIAVTDFEVEP
jgi:nitrous oxidase accessory protein